MRVLFHRWVFVTLLAVAVAAIHAGGLCAQEPEQKDYQQLQQENLSLYQQNQALTNEIGRLAKLLSGNVVIDEENSRLRQENILLTNERDALRHENQELTGWRARIHSILLWFVAGAGIGYWFGRRSRGREDEMDFNRL